MQKRMITFTTLLIAVVGAALVFIGGDAPEPALSAPIRASTPVAVKVAQAISPTPGAATPTPVFSMPQTNPDDCGLDCNPSEYLFETDLFQDSLTDAGDQNVFQLSRNLLPAPTPAAINVRAASVPLYQQKQSLTCEEASVAMATRGQISEEQLLDVLPRHDNPFVGIRGKTNSTYSGSLSDYGVYAHPLQKALSTLGIGSELAYRQSYKNFQTWVISQLRAGHPIVWWHTWKDTYRTPVTVKLSDGTLVKLVPYEHASVIVAANDRGITYHDPYDAKIRLVSWATFQRVSGYFDFMGLGILN